MTNEIKNIIRTLVPAAVGAALAYITKATAHIPAGEVAALAPVFATAYYSAVRFLENKYPALSWLLGALPVKAAGITPKDTPAAEATVTTPPVV